MTHPRREEFIHKLKEAVVVCCNVKKITAADIPNDQPIVGAKDKLQLDSLDALEIIVMVEERFGLRLSGDENSRSLFYSFNKMADYLLLNAKPEFIEAFLG